VGQEKAKHIDIWTEMKREIGKMDCSTRRGEKVKKVRIKIRKW
jgi:hypothetical protein